MSEGPLVKKDAMYQLLRDGKIDEFNLHKSKGKTCDLENCDFRGIDLQGLDASGLNMSGCYFRSADLRGVDFSNTQLIGASFHDAKISGVYFPKDYSPDEITMSNIRGTRMRLGC